MEHKISTYQNGIEIIISNIQDKHSELLQSFELCQNGQCTYPTNEYIKIQDLNVNSSENEITLNLIAKEGEIFDVVEIDKCISSTINKVTGN